MTGYFLFSFNKGGNEHQKKRTRLFHTDIRASR